MARYEPLRPFSVAFARQFKGYMTESGVTQERLAERLGRNQGYVSERVNGKRALDTEDVDALASLANVDGRELMIELATRARRLALVTVDDTLTYVGRIDSPEVERRAAETDDEDV